VNSPVPNPPSRLERALSALWIAAITALAIPALVAAFSRTPPPPLPDNRPAARPAVRSDVTTKAKRERAENANANSVRPRD
jgi:hypothetical protein